MHDTIEDGVGQGRIVEIGIPVLDRQLARDQGCFAGGAVVEQFEQVVAFGGIEYEVRKPTRYDLSAACTSTEIGAPKTSAMSAAQIPTMPVCSRAFTTKVFPSSPNAGLNRAPRSESTRVPNSERSDAAGRSGSCPCWAA